MRYSRDIYWWWHDCERDLKFWFDFSNKDKNVNFYKHMWE